MLWPSTSTLKVLSPYLQYDFSIKIDYCIHLNRSNLLLLHHQHFLQWVDKKVNFWFDLVRSLFLDFYISSTSGCLKSSLYFLHQHQISKQVYAYISLIVPNNHKILNQPKFRSPSYIVSFPTLKYWYYFSFIIITFFYPFWIYDITSHVVDQFWCCLSFALHVNSPNISNPHLMISSMALWLKNGVFFHLKGKKLNNLHLKEFFVQLWMRSILEAIIDTTPTQNYHCILQLKSYTNLQLRMVGVWSSQSPSISNHVTFVLT